MIRKVVLLLAVVLIHESESLKIPSYFKPCGRTDPKLNECVKKHGQEALPSLLKGDRKYRIPELNPLFLEQLNVASGGNLNIVLQNVTIGGLDGTNVQSADFNFPAKKLSMSFKVPKLTMKSKYEISGRILVLPISGKGPALLELEDLEFTYTFGYDVIKKNNEEYMKPKKGNIDYKLKYLKLNFDNLFNGDKVLGPETNNFLKENWREVDKELGPSIAEALSEVINLIITNVTNLVPFNELFPEKV